MFASLAAGRPTEDVLLETVGLDRLHRLGLRLLLGFGGHGQRGTDRRWVWRQRGVGTDGRGMGGRVLIGQGGFREGGRRWRGWRCGDEGWGRAGFTVIALEKVVHTLAAHDRFEGQGALQPLQLKDKKQKRRYVGDLEEYVKLQPVSRELCFSFRRTSVNQKTAKHTYRKDMRANHIKHTRRKKRKNALKTYFINHITMKGFLLIVTLNTAVG